MKNVIKVLIIGCIFLVAFLGVAAVIPPKQFATIAPLSAAASSTVAIEYENIHTVLFFDVSASSNATITILASPSTYSIVKTITSGDYKFFIHPLDTVFYAPEGMLTLTKEGTFTNFDIYVIETLY